MIITWILLLLLVVHLCLHLAIALQLLCNLRHVKVLQKLASTPFPGAPPPVSVIIPARNEEAEIGVLLKNLAAQDYPALEVIVVDDESTDRTAEIVRQFARTHEDLNLVLLEGRPPEPGWVGKCHAMQQGLEQAGGGWLLFLDTDMRLSPRPSAGR